MSFSSYLSVKNFRSHFSSRSSHHTARTPAGIGGTSLAPHRMAAAEAAWHGEDGLRSTGSGEGPAGHIAHIFAHSDSIMGSMMANLLLPSHRVEEDSWKNAAASADSDKFSQMNEWTELEQALPILPQAPGLFRIGYCKHPFMHTEVVLICHTTHKRTLAEVITSMKYGFEGGDRLMIFMVNPENRHRVYIKWRTSVYPEDIIEEEMEEFIGEQARVPRYNEPIRPEIEGVWAAVADDPSHPSNIMTHSPTVTLGQYNACTHY